MAGDFGDLEKPILGVPRMRKGETTRYVPNHPSFGAFIRSDQVRDPVAEVAQDIAALAGTNVRDQSGKEISRSRGLHDRVRAGFKVKRNGGLIKVAGNLRVRVLVENNVDGSALLEFGARGLPRQRMLGRAGAEFGDFKPEGGPT